MTNEQFLLLWANRKLSAAFAVYILKEGWSMRISGCIARGHHINTDGPHTYEEITAEALYKKFLDQYVP